MLICNTMALMCVLNVSNRIRYDYVLDNGHEKFSIRLKNS